MVLNQTFSEPEVGTINQVFSFFVTEGRNFVFNGLQHIKEAWPIKVFSQTNLELKIIGTKLCKKMQNTFGENIGSSDHSYV